MGVAARLDDFGKPAWIALVVLGFILCWPVGLAMLAFLIGSGRMGCWKHGGPGRWHHHGGGMDRLQEAMSRWQGGRRGNGNGNGNVSGNRAFDEYRAETLKRLEDEEREFREFLDRLRFAKDKAEFDEFLADRRRRSEEGPAPSPS